MGALSGRSLVVCASLVVVVACSTSSAPADVATPRGEPTSTEPSASTAAAAPPRATVRPDPLVRPVIDGAFDVGDGRRMYLQCWGEGSPTIVIMPGGGEIREFREPAAPFLSRLAGERRVCAYDRASHGQSDPAPVEKRQLEDVTDDLHALLEAAGVDGPQILVGPSFGGGLAMVYAHRFPDDIQGVVLFDVSKPEPVTVEEEPELAWDHPANAEHLDVINGFAPRLTNEQFPIIAPLLVVTAMDGESSVDDQAFWLDWSASSRQIEIPGEHDFYEDHPVEAADAILSMAE